jgi:ribosome biogenesis GTPase
MPHCDHSEAARDCGVAERVADGLADPARLESYRRLLTARAGEDDYPPTSTEPPERQ